MAGCSDRKVAFPYGQRPKGWRTKVYGAKARSSEELKFLSSQATLSYRVAVATDAFMPRRRLARTLVASSL